MRHHIDRSTLVLIAIFLTALVTYGYVRPEPAPVRFVTTVPVDRELVQESIVPSTLTSSPPTTTSAPTSAPTSAAPTTTARTTTTGPAPSVTETTLAVAPTDSSTTTTLVGPTSSVDPDAEPPANGT